MTPSKAHAYWDASLHRLPPSLPTTYGNFTVVNSIARFAFTTTASVPNQFQVAWTPSAIRTTALWGALTSTPVFKAWQQQQLNANNTVPLDIRPLRMSVKIKCTTQNLNIASNIAAVLIPQSIALQYAAVGTGSPLPSPTLSAAAWTSIWQLCEANPRAKVLSNVELAKRGSTFVMPPSSFQAYNSYSDWIPTSLTSDNGATLIDSDWLALNNILTDPTVFPATLNGSWFGAIPTNYVLLLNMEPNALAQTFEIEVFCQDGVRFPANSLVASMEHRPVGMPLTEAAVAMLASNGSANFHSATSSTRSWTGGVA